MNFKRFIQYNMFRQISNTATPIMQDIFAKFPTYSLAQQLSTMAMYEKDRVRSMSFKLLGDGLHKFCGDNENGEFSTSSVVRKYGIYTLIFML